MHLLDWLWSLLFGPPRRSPATGPDSNPEVPRPEPTAAVAATRVRLTRRTYTAPTPVARPAAPTSEQSPYLFARPVAGQAVYLDLTQDTDLPRLEHWGLPLLRTPEDLARWLELTPAQLAWLADRFRDPSRVSLHARGDQIGRAHV